MKIILKFSLIIIMVFASLQSSHATLIDNHAVVEVSLDELGDKTDKNNYDQNDIDKFIAPTNLTLYYTNLSTKYLNNKSIKDNLLIEDLTKPPDTF